jgi:hypothetical protein
MSFGVCPGNERGDVVAVVAIGWVEVIPSIVVVQLIVDGWLLVIAHTTIRYYVESVSLFP